MNDSSPLSVHDYDLARWPRRYQRVDVVLGPHRDDEVDGDPRPAAVLSESDLHPAAFEPEGGTEDFLRLWPNAGTQEDGRVEPERSLPLSMRMLQGAVIANGAALVALALVMAGPDDGSKAGLMASAIVLALGLMSAAVPVVFASLDFRGARLRIARAATSSRLATISGAVAYVALVLAAVPLI